VHYIRLDMQLKFTSFSVEVREALLLTFRSLAGYEVCFDYHKSDLHNTYGYTNVMLQVFGCDFCLLLFNDSSVCVLNYIQNHVLL
jgi:hypothetical protein